MIKYRGLSVDRIFASSCQCVVVPNITHDCKHYCLIENVVTHPNYRIKSCGKALLETVLKEAWAKGCYKAMLMTGRQQDKVLNFYKSAGFDDDKKSAFIASPPSNIIDNLADTEG